MVVASSGRDHTSKFINHNSTAGSRVSSITGGVGSSSSSGRVTGTLLPAVGSPAPRYGGVWLGVGSEVVGYGV